MEVTIKRIKKRPNGRTIGISFTYVTGEQDNMALKSEIQKVIDKLDYVLDKSELKL